MWPYLKKVLRRLIILFWQLSQFPLDLSHRISILGTRVFGKHKTKTPLNVLVIVHAFWPQQFSVVIKYLNQIKKPICIVVTIPDGEYRNQIERLISTISKHHDVSPMRVDNVGRDIGPFLRAIETFVNRNWDLVIKVHTKASQDVWFETLVRSLLQSDRRIENHARLLRNYPGSIIVHPFFRYPGHRQLTTEPAMLRLNEALTSKNFPIPKRWFFPAGSMFAASPAMLMDFKNSSETIGVTQFEGENDYSQASGAHVIERFLGLFAFTQGSGLICTSIFDYLDFRALLVKMI